MKRTAYIAILYSGTKPPETRTTYAWNSAIRAGEDLVRQLARSENSRYEGDQATVCRGHSTEQAKPATPGALYRRIWHRVPDGSEVVITVQQQ